MNPVYRIRPLPILKIEVREMWPVLTPGTHTNAMDAFDSALRIMGLADILIPQHDPSFVEVKSIP